jgi:hypothetical protein
MNDPISRLVLIPVFILIFIVDSIFIFFTFRPIGVTFFKRCWIQFFFLTDIGPSFFLKILTTFSKNVNNIFLKVDTFSAKQAFG